MQPDPLQKHSTTQSVILHLFPGILVGGFYFLARQPVVRLGYPSVFAQIMPGVLAMFTKQGWLVLLWGILCLPIGFAIQAIDLLKTHTIPRWQSILFLIGVLLVATPDGLEIINLSASILMAIAFVPYGIQIIAKVLKPFSEKASGADIILVDTAPIKEY